jgi:hypothetical protein
MAALTLRLVKGSPLTHQEGDDNFTNLNNELATKLSSATYTASDVLSKLLTVDGAGSGLDADLLDGQSGAYYTNIVARLGYTPVNLAGDTMTGALGVGVAAADGHRIEAMGAAVNGVIARFSGSTVQSRGLSISTFVNGGTNGAAFDFSAPGAAGVGGLFSFSTNGAPRVYVGDVGIGVGAVTSAGGVHIAKAGVNNYLSVIGAATFNAQASFAGNGNTLFTTSFDVGQIGTGIAELRQRANAALNVYTNNALRWGFTAAGNLVPGAAATHEIGSAAAEVATIYAIGLQRSTTGALAINAAHASGSIDLRVAGASAGDINSSRHLNLINDLRVQGHAPRTSGAGLELLYSGGVGYVQAYDRTGSAFRPVSIVGSDFTILIGGAGAALSGDSSRVLRDKDGYILGWRDLPASASLAAGKVRTASSGFTLNTSDLVADVAYSGYNNSGASYTITQGAGVTLRLAGTGSTGNRSIAARSFWTIWCLSSAEAIIMGSGVS